MFVVQFVYEEILLIYLYFYLSCHDMIVAICLYFIEVIHGSVFNIVDIPVPLIVLSWYESCYLPVFHWSDSRLSIQYCWYTCTFNCLVMIWKLLSACISLKCIHGSVFNIVDIPVPLIVLSWYESCYLPVFHWSAFTAQYSKDHVGYCRHFVFIFIIIH
jgi:hypothetical protein